MVNEEKLYYSVRELADILGISRIAVFKKIKKGDIRAIKIGRAYAVPVEEIGALRGESLTESQKKVIDLAVHKTVSEFEQTLKLLGKE